MNKNNEKNLLIKQQLSRELPFLCQKFFGNKLEAGMNKIQATILRCEASDLPSLETLMQFFSVCLLDLRRIVDLLPYFLGAINPEGCLHSITCMVSCSLFENNDNYKPAFSRSFFCELSKKQDPVLYASALVHLLHGKTFPQPKDLRGEICLSLY